MTTHDMTAGPCACGAWHEPGANPLAAHTYSWRRRSLSSEHSATITLARTPDRGAECAGPGKPPCEFCGSPVLLLVVDSTQDRRRLYALNGDELPHGLDFEEVTVNDEHTDKLFLVTTEDMMRNGALRLGAEGDGWDLERLWGEP